MFFFFFFFEDINERKNYILMERIKSKPRIGFLVRKNKLDV
jgi:hypothetical protein